MLYDEKTGKYFASKEEYDDIKNESTLEIEIMTYSRINNPAILKFLGYNQHNFEFHHNLVLITEYMKNSSLDKLLDKARHSLAPIQFTSTIKYIILLGVALGMKYLHSKGIIHRDLKPANILLDDNFYPKICDFGCSKISDKELAKILMNSEIGTPLYMAPEIYSGEGNYTYKVDVYAFSFVSYELITGLLPFKGEIKTSFTLMENVLKGSRPDLSMIKDDYIKKFIEKCWSQNPLERPSFLQIVTEILNDKFKNYFNVIEDDVEDYLELFDDELKSSNSKDVLDIKKMADEGDLYSIFQYERMLYFGYGTEINKKEYIKYLKIAADKGDPNSMYQYGLMLYKGNEIQKDLIESARYIKSAADLGNSYAMFEYSNFLFNGIGVLKNEKESYKYLKMSAENGNEKAMHNYAIKLGDGIGFPQNINERNKYLKLAADKGNCESMFNYANILYNGDGIEMNKKESAKYFKMSADRGHLPSMSKYGYMLLLGDGIEANLNEAKKYLSKVSNVGDYDCLMTLEFIKLNENKISYENTFQFLKNIKMNPNSIVIKIGMLFSMKLIDIKTSINMVKIAADFGDIDAILSYAFLLLRLEENIDESEMIERNVSMINNPNYFIKFIKSLPFGNLPAKKKAVKYFKKAADLNNVTGLLYYAFCLLNGIGIEQNKQEASIYYKKAADLGETYCMQMYGSLEESGFGFQKKYKKGY